MDPRFEIINVKAGIEEENAQNAEKVRAYCRENRIRFINVMGSPGAGKTTVLTRLIDALKDTVPVSVIEADVDADVDAVTVSDRGAKAVQLHTGGSCHMDALMTMAGLRALSPAPGSVVFLENIGNLVCPAEFDTGAFLKIVILSVPEGDDKPLKYPLMFTVADVFLINKIDTAPVFDFSLERFKKNVASLNESAPVFPVSGPTGEGFCELAAWIKEKLDENH